MGVSFIHESSFYSLTSLPNNRRLLRGNCRKICFHLLFSVYNVWPGVIYCKPTHSLIANLLIMTLSMTWYDNSFYGKIKKQLLFFHFKLVCFLALDLYQSWVLWRDYSFVQSERIHQLPKAPKDSINNLNISTVMLKWL